MNNLPSSIYDFDIKNNENDTTLFEDLRAINQSLDTSKELSFLENEQLSCTPPTITEHTDSAEKKEVDKLWEKIHPEISLHTKAKKLRMRSTISQSIFGSQLIKNRQMI